jgi:uncharacterized protein YkwD
MRPVVTVALACAIVAGPTLTTSSASAADPVAARTFAAVPTAAASDFEQRVLDLVNEARAKKRKCGGTTYKARKALVWDETLGSVARAHSADMAKRGFFNHTNPSGLDPFERMKKAGYKYRSAGENIAAGYDTPETVVKAWLKSKGHCKNIMSAKFTELGIGYVEDEDSDWGYYWTEDFGKPA